MEFPAPPRGIKALPWRFPIWIYRLGLGGLLGRRFLLLQHQGRKSGKLRQSVLEIVQAEPELNTYYVVSGFGTASDWYKNITNTPKATIQVGYQKLAVISEQLDPEEAGELMLEYARKYPKNLQALDKLMGYGLEHTADGYRAFGKQIPIIRFSPR
jgi:deazaflavin-dependent oxidoreductase (nitroreductase family)